VEIYQETGRPRQAAQAAGDFLNRRDAWSKAIVSSIWVDATLLFLKTRVDAGEMSKEDYAARRSEWMRNWERSLAKDMRGAAWIMGYALPASTAEDAKEALQVQPALMPGVYYWVSAINADSLIGKVYFLAGQPDKALPYLSRASADCGMLFSPVRPTIAHYHLGAALEAAGDTTRACAAYKVVLDRWGNATPGSLTAEKARARFKAIPCSP
jgi:tetratricopeptide (TPR) repeat protein